ncbi:MAG: hypothetical protein KDD69_13675 [Bdellovibrionales bacterium]|nr:hypothetical protein [Bdellovibrionales bacterium]
MVELSFLSLALLVLLLGVIVPLGSMLATSLVDDASWRPILVPAFGVLGMSALLSTMLAMGTSPEQAAWLLRLVVALLLVAWLRRGGLGVSLSKGGPFVVWATAYYSLLVGAAAFPEGTFADLAGGTVRRMTGLPIDNLISYNFARYLTEGISPDALEVVPTWSATSRGPLAGTFTAVMWLILGIRETEHWLGTTPAPYFVYHCSLVFLNLLSAYAVWNFAEQIFGRRVALLSLFALSLNSFFFINLFFEWPKLFMTYLLFAGAAALSARGMGWKSALAAGICFGGSLLAHDMALLYLLPAVGVLGILLLRSYRDEIRSTASGRFVAHELRRCYLQPAAAFVLGFLALVLPWFVFKKAFAGPSDARLVYLHLFCLTADQIENLRFVDVVRQYLAANDAIAMLFTRLGNLWFPFDPWHSGVTVAELFRSPYQALAKIAHVSFFQLLHALSVPLCLLLALGVRNAPREQARTTLRRFLLVCVGALGIAAVSFACPQSTLNHVWAYPALLVGVLGAAYAVDRLGSWAGLVFACGVALNGVVFLYAFWLSEQVPVLLSAGSSYLNALALYGAIALGSILGGLCLPERAE